VPSNRKRIRWFLKWYKKKVSPELIKKPDIFMVTRAIMGANDSAAGPDGIPFGAYKAILDIAATELLELIKHLMAGNPPPENFNFGLLHLLPKLDSGLVEDTRPITVTNSYNRLVAAILVECLTPALDALIDPSQKMFITGRHMTDLVTDINETYYKAVREEKEEYILFLDTRKAFDSIHHDYLLEIISHVGLPTWAVNIITSMLHQVRVSPVLANDASLLIWIRRGVKQGCPLSPLLFVLCYDPLIHAMQTIFEDESTLTVFAAADDIAVATKDCKALWPVMQIVDLFTTVSGLGINQDKSALLPTRACTNQEQLLSDCPWQDIQMVKDYKHLGVLMGYEITTENIFKKAHDKALNRIRASASVIRALPIHKRTIIINVFITPIYMYLGSFFIIPSSMINQYREACQRVVIPFNGTAFSYNHLCTPQKEMGFKTPLRDLWLQNFATVAAKFEFGNVDKETIWQHWMYEASARMTEHTSFAAAEFMLCWANPNYNKRTHGESSKSNAQIPPTLGTRKHIYSTTLSNTYSLSAHKGWPRKLGLAGFHNTHTVRDRLEENWKKASPSLPAYATSNHLRFLFNALPSSKRYRHFGPSTRALQGLQGDDGNCPFCHVGRDCYNHFSTDCLPVAETFISAWSFFLPNEGKPPSKGRKFKELLAGAFDAKTFKDPAGIINLSIAFVSALYFTRKLVCAGLDLSGFKTAFRRHISSVLVHTRKGAIKAKAKAEQECLRQISAIPPSSTIVYTDGSAFGNPGPSGAGAIISIPKVGHTYLYEPLGTGTNNKGELWAIGMALSFLVTEEEPPSPVVIITDSQLAMGLLTKGFRPKIHDDLIKTIIGNIIKYPARVSFIWSPGHAGIAGNEMADRLARKGSTISKKMDLPAKLLGGNRFSYNITGIPPTI
jgi:ribonuclease HI